MIDIENLVLNNVKTALITEYPNINVVSEYLNAPASFPCVSVVEEDNSVYQRSQDSDNNENHVKVMFSVNVYSNKTTGKKTEAKAIMKVVDSAFSSMKFTRTMKQTVNNIDTSIYRYTARYEAVIGKGVVNGKNTVFQVYRK